MRVNKPIAAVATAAALVGMGFYLFHSERGKADDDGGSDKGLDRVLASLRTHDVLTSDLSACAEIIRIHQLSGGRRSREIVDQAKKATATLDKLYDNSSVVFAESVNRAREPFQGLKEYFQYVGLRAKGARDEIGGLLEPGRESDPGIPAALEAFLSDIAKKKRQLNGM
ncbi:MAG: hypothetical protein R3F30_08990 [Planctomycetota bacterium]